MVNSAKLQPSCLSDRCELLLAEALRTAGAMRVANYKPLVLSVSCRACQLRRILFIAKYEGTCSLAQLVTPKQRGRQKTTE